MNRIGPHQAIICSFTDRARRRAMDGEAAAAEVGAAAGVRSASLSRRTDMVGTRLAVRHPVPLDQAQKHLEVEAFRDDGCTTHADREVDPDMRRRMIQRRRRKVDQAVAETP